jgi:transcriptional antiterminator RfaH
MRKRFPVTFPGFFACPTPVLRSAPATLGNLRLLNGAGPLTRDLAPCGSHSGAGREISSKSESGWGGGRANAGGARANSGGARSGAGRKPKAPIAAPVPVGGDRWYCVRTGLGLERTALIELGMAGFTVFGPNLYKPATRPKRDIRGVMRPGRPPHVVPLFPRYVFVRFDRADERWRTIRSQVGVECIMGATAERPIVVPDRAIDRIRALCAPNGCVYPKAEPMAVNTRARLLDGPLADLDGLCTWSNGKRVKLLLQFLGRPTLVEIAQDAVVAQAA